MLLQAELRLQSAIQQAYLGATRDELTKDHLTAAGVVFEDNLDASQMKRISAFIVEHKPENVSQIRAVFEAALVKELLHSAAQVSAVTCELVTFTVVCTRLLRTIRTSAESQGFEGGCSRG